MSIRKPQLLDVHQSVCVHCALAPCYSLFHPEINVGCCTPQVMTEASDPITPASSSYRRTVYSCSNKHTDDSTSQGNDDESHGLYIRDKITNLSELSACVNPQCYRSRIAIHPPLMWHSHHDSYLNHTVHYQPPPASSSGSTVTNPFDAYGHSDPLLQLGMEHGKSEGCNEYALQPGT